MSPYDKWRLEKLTDVIQSLEASKAGIQEKLDEARKEWRELLLSKMTERE